VTHRALVLPHSADSQVRDPCGRGSNPFVVWRGSGGGRYPHLVRRIYVNFRSVVAAVHVERGHLAQQALAEPSSCEGRRGTVRLRHGYTLAVSQASHSPAAGALGAAGRVSQRVERRWRTLGFAVQPTRSRTAVSLDLVVQGCSHAHACALGGFAGSSWAVTTSSMSRGIPRGSLLRAWLSQWRTLLFKTPRWAGY